MSVYISIEQQLTDAFNQQLGTDYAWADIELRALASPDFTYPPQYRATNTVATMGVGDEVVNVGYDRISIVEHFTMPEGLVFALPKTANGQIRQLAPYLGRTLGIDFQESDLQDDKYTLNSSLSSIVLRTAKTSLRWLPEESLTLTLPHRYRLRNGQCEMMPIQFNHGPDQWYTDHVRFNNYTGTRVFPPLLTGNVDYTPIREILRGVSVLDDYADDPRFPKNGLGYDQMLASAIASVDGQAWLVAGGVNKFNLLNAWPQYNGPTAGARSWALRTYTQDAADLMAVLELVNPDFDRVLIMRTNENTTSNLFPNFSVFHYNEAD